ncbi:hypothetical protein ON010_g2270 [Phytophthora cinnamomi]|nr:hypothetical protein ON010_g2270 [Phytophthora cinnamomi]
MKTASLAKTCTNLWSASVISALATKSAQLQLPKSLTMSAYAVAVTVSKVVTIITTIMMRISLLPDWNRWRKNRSTGDMSVLPSVLIFTNSYAVLFYAYAIDDFIPLFATSVLGVVVGIFLGYCFYLWAVDQHEVMRVFVIFFFVCLVITIYAVLAICGITGQSHSSTVTALGFIMIGCTSCMYASPMATIVHVVRTKTATSMPFTMGVVNVLNSFCWGVYGGLIHNNFLLIPNIIGVTLSSTQMLVTYIYRSKGPADEQLVATSNEDLNDVVDVDVVVVQPNVDEKGSAFVALRSPCGEDAKAWQTLGRSSRQHYCPEYPPHVCETLIARAHAAVRRALSNSIISTLATKSAQLQLPKSLTMSAYAVAVTVSKVVTIITTIMMHSTYGASSELHKFKLFKFTKDPRIAAIMLKKVPPPRISAASDISRILPMSLITKCEGLVVALQNRKTGLAENAIVVEIEPIGILHTAVLKIMKRSPRSTVIKTRLQNLQLFAAELEHLDLAGKRAVGDATMNFLLTKSFGGREGVAFIERGNISIVEGGVPRIGSAALSKLVGDLGKEFIRLPINCDDVHWCSIMIDIANAQVRVYDPMYSTYSDSVKKLAKTMSQVCRLRQNLDTTLLPT